VTLRLEVQNQVWPVVIRSFGDSGELVGSGSDDLRRTILARIRR
jgi:hypothetical protein